MNLGTENKQSMIPSSSGASKNSAGGGSGSVADQFPAGLRVLVVDDDQTCLMILEKMLQTCKYKVTKCNRAEVALSLLREKKNGYDVVISDVHMPDMDGFKLLEHIGLEMDLPVIMMSADDSKNVVMKGVTHGACDYLIKPVRIEALRNIWQHVVRKRKHEWKDFDSSASLDDQPKQQPEDPDYSSSANEGNNWKNNSKRRKDDDDEGDEREDSSSTKKPRVVWSVELHQQFVAAVNQLGIDKAVPKKILDLMNVPGLTRENVASHLQKYRLYLRRLSGTQHPGMMGASFMGHSDVGYGSIASLNELDLQALAASGQLSQLPAQSLATLQATALGRPTSSKSPISLPHIDQRNLFSFENPKLRYTPQVQSLGQSQTGKQTNLLHGIPTNMEPKQLVGLQHSFGSIGGQVLMPMSGQSQSQAMSNSNLHRIPGQTVMPNGMLTRGSVIDPYLMSGQSQSQTTPLVDFSMNQKTELTGNGFPIRGGGSLEPNVSRGGIIPGYEVFSDLNQTRPNWNLENMGLNFDAGQHSSNYASLSQKISGQGSRDVVFSPGEGSGTHGAEIPPRLKPDGVNQGKVFPEQYEQEDLLTAILKQQHQQEGNGQADNEFGFDW